MPRRHWRGITAAVLLASILVVLLVAVMGGGGSGSGSAAPTESPHDLLAGLVPSASPSPSPSPTPHPATSAQLAACYDGTCRITVVVHAKVRFKPQLGIPGPLSITVRGGTVSVVASSAGSELSGSLSGTGYGLVLNGLEVGIVEASGDVATLEFQPV